MVRSPFPGPSHSWRTFIRNHMSCTWAVDFFTVYTVTFDVLYVLIVFSLLLSLARRVRSSPFDQLPRFLVCDNDPLFKR